MLEEYTDVLTKEEIFPEGKLFRICYDASVGELKILAKHYDSLEELRNAFSAPNSGAFFARKYGYECPKSVYAINKFGYFLPGLLFEILQWIKLNFSDLSCVVMSSACKKYVIDYLTPLKKHSDIISTMQISNLSEDLGRNNELRRLRQQQLRQGIPEKKCAAPFEFRDYQKESIEYLLKKGFGRGLIEVPTAGGKSMILANFIWNIHKNIDKNYRYLILVPNKQLVVQFYKDLIDYGLDERFLTRFSRGFAFNKEAKIIIANRQYLFNNKSKLPKIDVLICDEAHTCTAEASAELITSLNCAIKIGCSGTLPRDKFQKWQLIGLFSKIVYEKDIVGLQEAGFISKLKITLLKITDSVIDSDRNYLFHLDPLVKYHEDEFGQSDIAFDDAYKAEHKYFEEHYKDLYKPVFDYLFTLKSNTLILFDRIEIGTNLFNYAKELYPDRNVFYIDGSIDVSVREQTRDKLEESDGNILLAQSATFATGINIKRLENLVFLTSSKSFSRVIQSIGRTLRLHESKSEAHLIDVSWNMKYSQKHLKERLKIYKTMYDKKPDEILAFKI